MEYQINRKVWQILWDYTLGSIGFGSNNGKHFSNDTFVCKAYDWNDDNIENNQYHFYHKPSGFKIQWYKYALRGAYCNMDISSSEFIDILYDCLNSLQMQNNVKILHDVNKWWCNEDENE